jgi:hypothetical protein
VPQLGEVGIFEEIMVVKEELIWGETDDFVGFRHFDSWETDEY